MKVALYARVSRDDDVQNPESQLLSLRRIAEARNLKVHKEYVDRASGKNTNRPGFVQMIHDSKRHAFDAIMVVKIDRLNRNALDAVLLLDELNRTGIGLIITEEGIDTTTNIGRAIYTIIAVLAELGRGNISDNTKRGLERAVAEGKTLGRPVCKLSPYQLDKARTILADEPNISQRALASRFEGVSRATLMKGLKEAGILE